MPICLQHGPAAGGEWPTETTQEENVSKGSRIKLQPTTFLTSIQGKQDLPGLH